MREIKFRAWDKNNDEMIFNIGITPKNIPYIIPDIPEYFDQFVYYDNAILLQYTGLKDKKGVEIYEGDIVETLLGNLVIEFSSGWFNAGGQRIDGVTDSIEVIGNIYENPELLEEK